MESENPISVTTNQFTQCFTIPGKKKGMEIWILGIVERETNRLVLYPVHERSADTLIRKYICYLTCNFIKSDRLLQMTAQLSCYSII